MKRIILQAFMLSALLLILPLSVSAQKKSKPLELKTYTDSVSYVIGSDVGTNLKKNMIDVNPDVFIKGLTNALAGADSLLSDEARKEIMTKLQQQVTAKQQETKTKETAQNIEAGKKFLDENKTKPGVIVTPSGLQYRVLVAGNGPKPTSEDEVTVNYEGKFLNGDIFDSSYERQQTATFPLNGVIPGWTEGLQLMSTGSTYEFYIPYTLAYGENGYGQIGGGQTLIFKVELISINKK